MIKNIPWKWKVKDEFNYFCKRDELSGNGSVVR